MTPFGGQKSWSTWHETSNIFCAKIFMDGHLLWYIIVPENRSTGKGNIWAIPGLRHNTCTQGKWQTSPDITLYPRSEISMSWLALYYYSPHHSISKRADNVCANILMCSAIFGRTCRSLGYVHDAVKIKQCQIPSICLRPRIHIPAFNPTGICPLCAT